MRYFQAELWCNCSKAMLQMPEVRGTHQQDFPNSQHNTSWNHSWAQHKRSSQTPVMEQFQTLHVFYQDLTRDLWTPAGRRKELPCPPGSLSCLKGMLEQAHWEQTTASVIDLPRRICTGIPRAMQSAAGLLLMGGPLPALVGMVTCSQACREVALNSNVYAQATGLTLRYVGRSWVHQSLVIPTQAHAHTPR